MAKQIMFDDAARHKMKAGIEKLAKTVRVTLGPAGRNVILQKSFGSPHVTKDGVSVAKEIEHEDPFENMGAKLVLEVANKTNDVAGDGTTTATVLASSIFNEGLKYAATGVSTIELRSGIEKAVSLAADAIAGQARKVKTKADKAAVATISANNDPETGELLAEAFEKVGDEGVITVEENKGIDTLLEHVEGMEFDKGYRPRTSPRTFRSLWPSTKTPTSSSATKRSRRCARWCRPSRPPCAAASRCSSSLRISKARPSRPS